ncbi:MAG: hypothetical protein JWO12_564 [Frankiales bacterium]|nr:hypothetical protein [Frankiales bacterium]
MDVVDLTRQTYDQVAADYDVQTRVTSPAFEAFRDAFVADARGRVADLGCGPGQHLQVLLGAGLDAFGVDLSDGMLAIARTRGRVVRGDLRRPPMAPASLDGIWSSAALLHVPREDVPATLTRWRELLKPGGLLALSTSLGGQQGWEKVPYATPKPVAGQLDRWFVHHDRDELLSLLAEAGFTVTSAQTYETKRLWVMVRATA